MVEKHQIKSGMVDSHFHTLHMIARDLPGEAILEECFAAGMSYGLDVGIVAETFARRAELASRFPRLYLASGFYPSACEDPRWRDKLPLLEDHLIHTPKAVALGEIGLDFNRMYGTRESQGEVMAAQIELANRLGLPVIIHSRDAAMETLELLHRYTPLKGGILHCFSYGPEWVDRFAELDLFFSFAGNITYKKCPEIREAVKQVPPDRLLVETDAPYLSPQPVRHRINHPGLIGYTYEAVARETGRSLDELISLVNDNFVRFLSLSGRFVP